MSSLETAISELEDRTLLLLEDDRDLRHVLGMALGRLGFDVLEVESLGAAMEHLSMGAPAFAIVDLRLADGSGLIFLNALRRARPGARAIIHTGHGDIATAVAAAKSGAVDYVCKPAQPQELAEALLAAVSGKRPKPPSAPLTPAQVRWEHIQRTYEACGHNVSQTARRLSMHRRTLQRILNKHQVGVSELQA